MTDVFMNICKYIDVVYGRIDVICWKELEYIYTFASNKKM